MAPIQDPPLPKYQSHKVVSALKVFDVVPVMRDGAVQGATLYPHDLRFSPIPVTREWYEKRIPAGDINKVRPGYFVRYGDGDDAYTSWSPVKEFEEGYTLIG